MLPPAKATSARRATRPESRAGGVARQAPLPAAVCVHDVEPAAELTAPITSLVKAIFDVANAAGRLDRALRSVEPSGRISDVEDRLH